MPSSIPPLAAPFSALTSDSPTSTARHPLSHMTPTSSREKMPDSPTTMMSRSLILAAMDGRERIRCVLYRSTSKVSRSLLLMPTSWRPSTPSSTRSISSAVCTSTSAVMPTFLPRLMK